MPLTPEQYQTLIITEVGDDAAGTLATNIGVLWAGAGASSPGVYQQYLIAKRSAIDLLLGGARFQVDFRALDGASVDLDQIWRHLMDLRKLVEGELAKLGASAGIAIGELVQTAPIMPDRPGPRDPNSRRLRGDPLCP